MSWPHYRIIYRSRTDEIDSRVTGKLVMQEAGIFLRAELQTLNSATALRRYIRRMHKEDAQSDISPEELEAQFATITARIKADDDFGRSIRNTMLKDSVRQLFADKHGESIVAYTERLLAQARI